MKTVSKQGIRASIYVVSLIFMSGCEREMSDSAVPASFPTTAEVYTDGFIGLGSNFYFPFADAKPDVFSVDNTQGYQSNSSIRIDVPNANDPSGNYAGAIFREEGPGRNLSGYDALTFYVKSSTGVQLGNAGFGINYLGDQYRAAISNINVGTNWTKVIVPIPDASKLKMERGLFWFAAGTQSTAGSGYTLWFDEIKYEKLGLVSTPAAAIYDGANAAIQAFVGSTLQVSGLKTIFNIAGGSDISVDCASSYFNFFSSDTSVATVNESGLINIKAKGTAEITAKLAGKMARGKLVITSAGSLPPSPTPTHPAANVLSLFSDAYTPATLINYAPGFGGSTTSTTLVETGNGKVLEYKNNNYTGIMFNETPLNGSSMTFLHIDVYVQNSGGTIGIQIRDIGANKTLETDVNTGNPMGDDKDYRQNMTGFTAGSWKSFDIPLGGNIANQKSNLGALIITGGPDFILDNIYFYKP